MGERLKANAGLAEELNSVLSILVRQLALPITPAPGDPTPPASMGSCIHIHNLPIKNKINYNCILVISRLTKVIVGS